MSLIEMKEIKKSYAHDGIKTEALSGITLAINAGEFVAIMGPSGSGKSTLLHILGFLDKQSEGEYLFEGKSFEEFSEDEIAHIRNAKMGFIFQSFYLLVRTSVFENVKLPLLYSSIPKSQWQEKVTRAIASVGLSHRTFHESAQLSGGEKQRVAIARALVTTPQVIFADEPTGNLDSKVGREVLSIIQSLSREQHRTVVLITHDSAIAQYADRIISLRDGKKENDIRTKKI